MTVEETIANNAGDEWDRKYDAAYAYATANDGVDLDVAVEQHTNGVSREAFVQSALLDWEMTR